MSTILANSKELSFRKMDSNLLFQFKVSTRILLHSLNLEISPETWIYSWFISFPFHFDIDKRGIFKWNRVLYFAKTVNGDKS